MRLYATSDARFLAVGALEQKFWSTLCEAVGLPGELRDDRKPPHATQRGPEGHHRRSIRRTIGSRSLEPLDCCCTIVASLEEALADPHFVQRGLFDSATVLPNGATLPAIVLPIARQFRGDPEP